jgi:hypothetical protein
MERPVTARDALAAIREREWKATQGPWAPWLDQDGAPHMNGLLMVGNAEAAVIPEDQGYIEGVDVNPIAHTYTPEDREFIAHARTDVPALVEALEAVLAMHVRMDAYDNDALVDFCDRCQRPWPCETVTAIETELEPR